MRATGKIIGVTTQSVMRWIRKMHGRFVPEKPDISTVTEIEMDEMYHYFKKKLIGWALEHRDTKTLVRCTTAWNLRNFITFMQFITKVMKSFSQEVT